MKPNDFSNIRSLADVQRCKTHLQKQISVQEKRLTNDVTYIKKKWSGATSITSGISNFLFRRSTALHFLTLGFGLAQLFLQKRKK